MPLYKTLTPNSQTTVKIWNITESYKDLFNSITLKPTSLQRVLGMRSELHQRGFLSVRKLLADFGYNDTDLYYDNNGKPHLTDGKHISITHSFTFSAVVISDAIVGIDIEKRRNKIELIAEKFVDYEFDYLKINSEDYINKLTVIWCIKESLYKLYATPGLSFKQHTLVIPFEIEDETTLCWIDYNNYKERFIAQYLELEGFTFAIAFPA